MKPRESGFTLIELMITVAIIAILASIAYPSYTNYVNRSNRSEMAQFLLDAANRQEEYLLSDRTYANALAKLNIPLDPNSRLGKLYAIKEPIDTSSSPPTFTIIATPRSGTMQAKDPDNTCAGDPTAQGSATGELRINSLGERHPICRWTK